jgi:long-subunit acyl-CoA synthetase (AMP-forming)
VLTHVNESFATDTAVRVFHCTAADRVLAFMPLSNATERLFTLYMPIITGALIYYCDDLAKLHDHISGVCCVTAFCVPNAPYSCSTDYHLQRPSPVGAV